MPLPTVLTTYITFTTFQIDKTPECGTTKQDRFVPNCQQNTETQQKQNIT